MSYQNLIKETEHKEQEVMENRYRVPYNWCSRGHSRGWRAKSGLWVLAHNLSGNLSGKKVLDAGCGDGWYTDRISKEAGETFGADYSPRAIGFASLIVSSAKFKVSSLLELPFPDNYFDVIFSFQVLEHIPPQDFDVAVGELARVLKDGGVLVASVPSVNRPMSSAHFRHFTLKSFSDAMSTHFFVEKALGQERHSMILHLLERLLENRFWLLTWLASYFNNKIFPGCWNETSPEKGQNLVVRLKKKNG